MRRVGLALSACLVLFASPSLALDPGIRIGAWNLLADKSGSNRFIPKKRVPRIAKVIALLNVDVLAVSEVAPNQRFKEITEKLGEIGHCYNYTYRSQPSAETKMNVGFLHRCGVTVSDVKLISHSGYTPNNKREALSARFKVGNLDFFAIAVHLKSGGGFNERSKRDVQAQKIWAFIEDNLLSVDKDVFILGDYNMDPDRDPQNFATMNPDDALRYISSEELEPRPGYSEVFSHISKSGGPGNLLDGFSIHESDTTEYVKGSIEVVPMDDFLEGGDLGDFAENYSDHLPLVAEFKNADED